MPLPPALITARTFSSDTFLPFFSLSRLNNPLSDGPTFFSSVSVLWHTAQFCSKVSLPFAASPFCGGAASDASENSRPAPAKDTVIFRIIRRLRNGDNPSLQSPRGGAPSPRRFHFTECPRASRVAAAPYS